MQIGQNTIISSICPSNQCCQQERVDGCSYIHNTSKLCAAGRNYESTLCSLCIDGYSETINSANCKECHQSHMAYLFIPFLLAFFITLFLVGTNTDNVTIKSVKKETASNLEGLTSYPERDI